MKSEFGGLKSVTFIGNHCLKGQAWEPVGEDSRQPVFSRIMVLRMVSTLCMVAVRAIFCGLFRIPSPGKAIHPDGKFRQYTKWEAAGIILFPFPRGPIVQTSRLGFSHSGQSNDFRCLLI